MNKLTKKQKIQLVRRYFGSSLKSAYKYVNDQKNEKVYDYMIDFFKAQAIQAFYED